MQEQIEGVPVGTKIARIGLVKQNDVYIDIDGRVVTARHSTLGKGYAIIEPDNAYNVIDLDSIENPVGHRRVGFREPLDNELYINAFTYRLNSQPYNSIQWLGGLDKRRIIVEPIPKPKKLVLVVEYELEDCVDDVANVLVSYKNTSYLSYPAFRVEEREA